MSKHIARDVTAIPTPWQDVLLLCRKCDRRLDGGFGEDEGESLRRVLRGELRRRGRRRDVRVMEVGCLGVCPKGAVVAARGDRPGELLLVPRGTAADAVLDRLLPGRAAAASLPEGGGGS